MPLAQKRGSSAMPGTPRAAIAACARAHLQDDVAVVVRIAGNQVQQKRLLQRRNLRFQTLQLLAGGFAQLWILGQLARIGNFARQLLIIMVR